MKDKVLYLPGFSPFSTNGGGNQRCHLILKALEEIYDVDLIVDFDEISPEIISTYKNEMPGVNVIDFPQVQEVSLADRISRKLKTILNPLSPESLMSTNLQKYKLLHNLIESNNYKWVITRYLFMVPYYRLYNLENLVVDIDDIPYKKMESMLKFKHGVLTQADLKTIKRYKDVSHKTAEMAKILFLPDQNDCILFPGSHYLPNIPLEPKNKYVREPEFRIMFVGSMTQDMNYEGVDHFIKQIWPKILKINPELEFHVIGRGAPEKLAESWYHIPGVKLRGFVEDIDLEYSQSIAAIAPIYTGAGTNIKVLEAISHKCPIVTSRFAMRGFNDDFIHMKDILIANNDSEFANYVNLLVNDRLLNSSIADSGYRKITEKYSLTGFKKQLQTILKNYD